MLRHVGGAWQDLRGARLFITGGTGFFGKWLLESFVLANTALRLDASAVVLTRDPAGFARAAPHLATAPAIQTLAGTVQDFAFPPGRFSHLIHAATPSSAVVNDQTPDLMLDVIVQGTRRVLELAGQKGINSMLLTSSGAVYGPSRTLEMATDTTRIAETARTAPDTMNPKSAYAEGKRLAELMCAIAAERLHTRVAIARCFAFVGPYLPLDQHFAIGNLILNALRGEPMRLRGDGRAVRSYLHAADLTTALWTLLLKGDSCRPYNIGSPAALSILDLARTVAAVTAPQTPIEVAGAPNAGMDYYVPDTSRYDSQFGSQTRIGLEEAIRRTFQFHRKAQTH